MTIEGIGPAGPVGKEAEIRKDVSISQKSTGADSVDFSQEARIKGEFDIAKTHVHKADDIRAEKVAQAKARINDPAYLDDSDVIETVAERISDLFLG